MANDLHIFLSEEEFAQIRAIAKREDRSVSNLARVYIRRALAADGVADAPISPHKTLDVLLGRAVPVKECVTTDEPGPANHIGDANKMPSRTGEAMGYRPKARWKIKP